MTKGRPTIDGPHNRPFRICHTLNSVIGLRGSPTEGTWDAEYQRCPPLQTWSRGESRIARYLEGEASSSSAQKGRFQLSPPPKSINSNQ